MIDIPAVLPTASPPQLTALPREHEPVGTVQTAHVAADPTRPLRAPTGPELNSPVQAFDARQAGSLMSSLDSTIQLLLLLFKFSRESREQGIVLRDIENQSMIIAQRAQVEEMRKGVNLTIAMSVVSGVMAAGAAAVGGWGAMKNGKLIRAEKVAECGGRMCAPSMGKTFDLRNTKIQSLNSVNQSVGQMNNTALQAAEKGVQASAKECEIASSLAQNQKQKVDDQLTFNTSFMRDVIQLLQQLAQNSNQAWRAAAGVV